MTQEGMAGRYDTGGERMIQDRYSLRCYPQYLAPILEGFAEQERQLSIEMNCANDNPLLDHDNGEVYNGGNFLGQVVGVGMDQFRYYLGLLAKHIDVQIAQLVTPEFSNGLPPSLIGNPGKEINMGLKAMQIVGNSIMPMLSFFGNSIADRYPTHAEQYNQNINSQGFASATLARQSVSLFEQYLAVALVIGIQAVDLRAYKLAGHYDARELLSPVTVKLYDAVLAVLDVQPRKDKPYLNDDSDLQRDLHVRLIAQDLEDGGVIADAVEAVEP